MSAARIEAHLRRRERWRPLEIVFWLALLATIFLAPSRAALVNEILINGLFALSLDLILGLAGIVSLGHAAFLGCGAYAAAILANGGCGRSLAGPRGRRPSPRRFSGSRRRLCCCGAPISPG